MFGPLCVERLESRTVPTFFGPPTHYGTGHSPYALAAADWDGNGTLDLLATPLGPAEPTIHWNNGDGNFRSNGSPPFVQRSEWITVGDFNEDGPLDYAVTFGADVGVRLGNGDGTFRPVQLFAVGGYGRAVASGDFDQDGHLDLVTGDSYNNHVSFLRGTGDGRFHTYVHYRAPAPYHITVGDYNADGSPDLAMAYYTQGLSVLLGNGDGSFQPAHVYLTGDMSTNTDAGDFDGDGDLDLAVASYGSQHVSVLLNHGDGTFGAPVTYGASVRPSSVAVADYNGDGVPDLAVVNEDGRLSLLLGVGDGRFEPPYTYPLGGRPQYVIAADFSGDLAPDLIVSDVSAPTLAVLLNTAAVPTWLEMAAPQAVPAWLPFDLVLNVRNQFGGLARDYRGTLRFGSSDLEAVLPPDYTFSEKDQGTHTFSITLASLGKQTVTVTDLKDEGLATTVAVLVEPGEGGMPGPGGGWPSFFSQEVPRIEPDFLAPWIGDYLWHGAYGEALPGLGRRRGDPR